MEPNLSTPNLSMKNHSRSLIETKIFHKHSDDDNSFSSSISSLHENDWVEHSLGSKSFVVDNLPSTDSCDETKSVTKSQSFSTHDHDITLEVHMPQNITDFLSEKVATIESINWLGRHVPRCVIRDLYREVLRIRKQEAPLEVQNLKRAQSGEDREEHEYSAYEMPQAKTYSAALLFIDMSGFSKLSLLLDLESLSKVRNTPLLGILLHSLFFLPFYHFCSFAIFYEFYISLTLLLHKL